MDDPHGAAGGLARPVFCAREDIFSFAVRVELCDVRVAFCKGASHAGTRRPRNSTATVEVDTGGANQRRGAWDLGRALRDAQQEEACVRTSNVQQAETDIDEELIDFSQCLWLKIGFFLLKGKCGQKLLNPAVQISAGR